MTVLALIFTVALAVELAYDLSPRQTIALLILNGVIWLLFVAEYVVMLRLAPDRRRFVRTHLLDLIVVLLPMLRPVRALRLVAVAARSWRQVFSVLRHRGLGKIIGSVGALMLVGGLITFALEPTTFGTVGNAMWWVLVTSTTVGYGDFAPVGAAARLVAMVVMLLGIGLVGVITANIVDFMTSETAGSRSDRRHAAPTTDACDSCRTISERLTTIEAQLARLLEHGAAPDAARDVPPVADG